MKQRLAAILAAAARRIMLGLTVAITRVLPFCDDEAREHSARHWPERGFRTN